MGNGNLKATPLNSKCQMDIPSNNNNINIEKKTGKSFINSILAKFEIFERKEINITINNPLLNISNKIKVLNEENLDNILHDFYPNYSAKLIPTLNGYILSKEDSLKSNNIHDMDEIYVADPINFYFSFSDGNYFPCKASPYQIFFDVFQRFRLGNCPKEYINRFSECYFNEKLINNFDIIYHLGIQENSQVFVSIGIDNNTKCLYDKGLEAIKRFNFIYKKEENKINLNDIKIELYDKVLDNEELYNFSIINFNNLKQLYLIDCKIQTLSFLNSIPLAHLQEINLQKNKISYFENLYLYKLELFDLSYNNLNKNMLHENNIKKTINISLPSLRIFDLSNNKIENIDILCQFKIELLKELYLNNNDIQNIKAFDNVTCGKLKKLNLSNNKINDINVFTNLSFCNNIEDINLMNNEIVNLNILRNVSLPKLKTLNLLNNDITDYSVFALIYFPKLEILYSFPSQLDPDDYDKSSDTYNNFISSCDNIKEKGVEVKFKL